MVTYSASLLVYTERYVFLIPYLVIYPYLVSYFLISVIGINLFQSGLIFCSLIFYSSDLFQRERFAQGLVAQ
jgi:hypothetical protein